MRQKTTQLIFSIVLMTICFGLKAQNNAFFYLDGNDCKKVYFYDSIFSFRPTQYNWNFGDGNSSTLAAPNHTYASNGTYNVTFYAFDSASNKSATDTLSIIINCGPCTNFKAKAWNYTDRNNCKKINFVNTSSTGTYNWDFGDGNTSTTKSPAHTYTSDGTYTVSLKASDSLCADSTSFTVIINCSISKCDSFFARASYTIDSADCKKVYFTNNSPAGNYSWIFGDGNTSTSANPTHTYAIKGNYTVYLEVWDSFCSDSIFLAVNASCTPPDPCKGFKALIDLVIDSTNTSKALLYNRSTGNVNSHFWNFGDGTTSTLAAPSHTYTSAGRITLTYIAKDTLIPCEDTASITFTVDSLGNIRRGDIKMVLNIIDQTQNATRIQKTKDNTGSLKIYPNPIDNEIRLLTSEATHIDIYNLQGQNIFKIDLKENKTETINSSSWSKGVYIILSSSGSVQKIIKN